MEFLYVYDVCLLWQHDVTLRVYESYLLNKVLEIQYRDVCKQVLISLLCLLSFSIALIK